MTATLVWHDIRRQVEIEAGQFERAVNERAQALQERFDRSLAHQLGVSTFLRLTGSPQQASFENFLDGTVGADRPFSSIQFVPRVALADRPQFERLLREQFGMTRGIWQPDPAGQPRSAGSRDEYFPVFLIYPQEATWLRGLDANTEAQRREAILRALATGQAVSTGPVRLVQRPQEWGFVVSVPLRSSLEPCQSEAQCRESTFGFTVGVYVISDLLAPVLDGMPDGTAVYVYSDTAANALPIYATPGDAPTRAALEARPVQWRALRSAQRIWHVAFVAGRPIAWARSSGLIALLGIALTAALVFGQLRARRIIDRLHEARRESRTLIANLPGAAYRVRNTPLWPAEFFSEGIRELTGYAVEDLLAGKPAFGELMLEEDRERVWEAVQGAIAERRRFQVEYRIRAADGRIKWIWEQGIGVVDAAGELRFIEGFVTDVTERRRDQEAAATAEKQEAVRNLTAGLAHEFNNALAVVIGNIDLALASAGEKDKVRRHLELAQAAALRGVGVTKSLTAVASRQSLVPQNVNLNQVVRDLLPLIRKTLGPAAAVVTRFSDEEPVVRADPGGLNTALLNLVIAARDSMPSDGKLVIETHIRTLKGDYGVDPSVAPGRYAVVALRDTGAGMSKEAAERAFDPYARTNGDGRSRGLDLAMVFGFARQSGGTATVHSELGKGTTVRIYLPAPEGTPRVAGVRDATTVPNGQERILVVGDEVALVDVAREWLESLGYHVTVATGSEDALARLAHNAWDLMMTDIGMPGLDGIELARRARAQQPGLRILLATGLSAPAAAALNFDAPVLQKPYRKGELARAVRDALDGRRT